MKIVIPALLIFVLGCNSDRKTETLSGDLYFSFFRIGSYYNQPDSMIRGFERYIDTIEYEAADKEQKRFLDQFRRLKEEGLLYHPYVQVKDASDSVLTLYLEKNDYEKIKIYRRKELQNEGKRIRIEADVKRIDDGLFYCLKLLNVGKIDGVTGMKSSKWKVEDYN